MRVLMLTCFPSIQGPFPKILPSLAAALRSLGCFVAEEPWGRHHEEETFFEKLVRRPRDIGRVYHRLRRETFDVLLIHTTTEWPNYSRDIPVLWLCRRLVPRRILQFHGSTPDWVLGPGRPAFKKASRMLLRLADAVFVLSSEEQREWQRFHPAGRFHVVRNPFPAPPCAGDTPALPPWKRPPGVPVLLYVGRLIEAKGIFDLVDAVARLRGRVPCHLLMAGDGPDRPRLETYLQQRNLEGQVTLAGYLPAAQLQQVYRAADLFVLPSWSEGFPTVLLEAMDAGLPVVTTSIRGAVDHLQDGVHARFVPPRQPEQLALALEQVLGDQTLRERMGQANRAKVREFAPESVASDYLALLQQVAGHNVPSQPAGVSARMAEQPGA